MIMSGNNIDGIPTEIHGVSLVKNTFTDFFRNAFQEFFLLYSAIASEIQKALLAAFQIESNFSEKHPRILKYKFRDFFQNYRFLRKYAETIFKNNFRNSLSDVFF